MLKLDQIFGFVMNIPSECRLGVLWLPLKRRHWISIKNINGIYYNLDSKLPNPSRIGNVINCIELLLVKWQLYLFYICRKMIFLIISEANFI